MSLCTFIVPTIGRNTLERSLKSLLNQTDPDWNALVIADSVPDFRLPQLDNRIYSVNLLSKTGGGDHQGGYVRNQGIFHASGDWIAFVDDDDRLDKEYVAWLRADCADCDLLVFRMKHFDGNIVPPLHVKRGEQLGCGNVGISFAIRTAWQRQHKLLFGNSTIEDWAFLEVARSYKARFKISPHLAYYVRDQT